MATTAIARTIKSKQDKQDLYPAKMPDLFPKKMKIGAKESVFDSKFGLRLNGKRVANFSAGPAAVSDSALLKLRDEMLSFEDSGMSLMEQSHRDVGGNVQNVMEETCQLIKDLLDVPKTHEVLLMQGGAHAQFAGVPLNLLGDKKKAAYVDGGFWSHKAAKEASRYCEPVFIAPVAPDNSGKLVYPKPHTWKIPEGCAYVHICANETINGMEFLKDPAVGTLDCPLVGDFTSTLLSRPVDVSKYGVIYASGGKNLGPSGVCVVIINKALFGRALPICPGMMSYAEAAVTKPLPNLFYTPNVFGMRAINIVATEYQHWGGMKAMKARNARRAKALYKIIDQSNGFYINHAKPEYRSTVTIPINIRNKALEAKFTREAKECNLHHLDGHHSVGGLRVCLYNSIPDCAVECLLEFMVHFQRKYATQGAAQRR